MRQAPGDAVHASPTAGRFTAAAAGRVLAVATAVGLFISLFGPFDQGASAFLKHAAGNLAFSWTGSMLGYASVLLVRRLGLTRNPWITAVAAGLMMAPAQGLVVWLGVSLLNGRWLPATSAPQLFWDTVLICIGSCFAAVMITRRSAAAAPAAAAPVKFLERLPLKLRGADVWAVEAEDHYLRLHTSKGQDLILLRLADAIAELDGIEGAQVHRSWWVAREAITAAKRGDGRATLTLRDGSEVPVSRTYAAALRERRWF